MAVDEQAIAAALHELENTENPSIRGLAKKYGIPRGTLRRRIDHAQPHATGHQAAQKLAPADEEHLMLGFLSMG
jgi:hypothetical protein